METHFQVESTRLAICAKMTYYNDLRMSQWMLLSPRVAVVRKISAQFGRRLGEELLACP